MNIFSPAEYFLKTGKIQKENFIIVSGYNTNSILLKNFITYLQRFYNVYFLDLPGFISEKKPILHSSIDELVAFVEKEINKTSFNTFILGGISFGFYLANKVKIDKRCKAIFGVEPYVGEKSLVFGEAQKKAADAFFTMLSKSEISTKAWKNKHFHMFLSLFTKRPIEEIEEVMKEVNDKSFFETGRLILEEHAVSTFHDIPYLLAINRDDDILNAAYVISLFKENAKELFIIPTTNEHYPKDMSISYFEEHIPSDTVYKSIRWLNDLAKNK